jgi:hypothetical protein
MHNEKILELQHKAETVKEIAESTRKEIEELRETLKRLDGFAYGHKEIASKFKDHVKKQQDELVGLANEGKIAPAVVSFVSSYVLASQKFLNEAEKEARKLLHTRQGELIAIVSNEEKLRALAAKIEEEIGGLVKEAEKKEEEAVAKQPSPAAPSEKSQEIPSTEPTKNKRKNSRKRPDEAGALADTVKRLKAARGKKG